MRLVITSDCHGKLQEAELPAGDILILAGDVFANRSAIPERDAYFQLNEMHELDAFCGALPYAQVLLIAGNHDWLFEVDKLAYRQLQHITYLQDSGIEIDGVKFYGSPHQPWFYDWAFNLPRKGKELAHYWSLIPEDTEVLITHGPPYGILDRPFGIQDHVGCELLLQRVSVVQPRVHAFGHIHGSYGQEKVGNTLFVNASLCNETYKATNPPIVVDID
ncbi:MAG: metallophosphatase domain-containing protein [Acidobacteria bacterium]|nr:metallophosphatase domain-containing protein [Acidobacteriota bacterium]